MTSSAPLARGCSASSIARSVPTTGRAGVRTPAQGRPRCRGRCAGNKGLIDALRNGGHLLITGPGGAPYGSVGVDTNCAVIGFIDKPPTSNLEDPVPNSQSPPR
jgi:hypothetical protein